MKAVHIAFGLSAYGSELESYKSVDNALPQLRKALDSDVLKRVLQASQQIRYKFCNRASVKDRSGHALSNQETITFGKVASCTSISLLTVLNAWSGLFVFHSIDTSHATVSLNQLSLLADEVVSRRFGSAGKETTHHHG